MTGNNTWVFGKEGKKKGGGEQFTDLERGIGGQEISRFWMGLDEKRCVLHLCSQRGGHIQHSVRTSRTLEEEEKGLRAHGQREATKWQGKLKP